VAAVGPGTVAPLRRLAAAVAPWLAALRTITLEHRLGDRPRTQARSRRVGPGELVRPMAGTRSRNATTRRAVGDPRPVPGR